MKVMSSKTVKLAFSQWQYKDCSSASDFERLCEASNLGVALYEDKRAPATELNVTTLKMDKAKDDEKPLAWAACTVHGTLAMLGE